MWVTKTETQKSYGFLITKELTFWLPTFGFLIPFQTY